MIVIPAIDLLGGKCVRLRRGSYDDVTTYEAAPDALAARWSKQVPILHVVDLEGARAGKAVQRDVVRAIALAFGPGLQVGGGVRSEEAIESYFELGAERVVLGTAAVEDPELVKRATRAHPGRIVIALDARDGRVATRGWEKDSDRSVLELARELEPLELGGILYTDIERDGTEVGPNLERTSDLCAATRHPVIASGGVGTLDHVRALTRARGPIFGAVIGRALHEGRFTLASALDAAH
jgi:phosphoribosylformimino-5-aminoimidazole carboxamide ribotide isomerase